MIKVLISWLGDSDIRNINAAEKAAGQSGPLCSILSERVIGPFDELWLFSTSDIIPYGLEADARAKAVEKLRELTAANNIKLSLIEVKGKFDVANPAKIYELMSGELEKKAAGLKTPAGYFYNLTSGTPAMYAIQLHMSGYSPFAGVPLYAIPPAFQNSEPSNVREAPMPFALSRLRPDDIDSGEPFYRPNKKIYEQIRRKVAQSNASVLIQGETGTGKSFLARFIHDCDTSRNGKKMVELNCAAFANDASALKSELFGHVKGAFTGADRYRNGAFREADGSTLFLDEVGEIPLEQQGMLLKVLDEGRFQPLGSDRPLATNARIIAATNVDLTQAVREGRFRSDLYYRLAQYAPRLKSVREYSEADRLAILKTVWNNINAEGLSASPPKRLTDEARRLLLAYPWYGNIREMKFRLKSIHLLADDLVTGLDVEEQLRNMPAIEGDMANRNAEAARSPDAEAIPADLRKWLKKWQDYWLAEALARSRTDAEAAKLLGLPASTFSTYKARMDRENQ